MSKWQLIYFDGCPNADKLKQSLMQVGITEFESIEQGTLESAHPSKKYASPSLLKDGKLVVGTLTEASDGGCSLGFPSIDELRAIVEGESL